MVGRLTGEKQGGPVFIRNLFGTKVLLEVFHGNTTRKRCRGRPRTDWRDPVRSGSAVGVPQQTLLVEQLTGDSGHFEEELFQFQNLKHQEPGLAREPQSQNPL